MTQKELKTRRDALREILGTVAAAAALTEIQVAELLAQVKKVPDLAKLASIRTTDNTVKALKILLAPKAEAARVFQSEYGRKPALAPRTDAKTGTQVCPAYLGWGGACSQLDCGLVVCNGLEPGGKPQLGTDVAQSLPSRGDAASGGCQHSGYNKEGGSACSLYIPPTVGFLNARWLQARQGDPYIRGLMREFGVDSAAALELELTRALADRRLGR